MALQTFTLLANQYDPAIANGVNRIISNAISGNADTITDALTLYVIVVGGMMCFREMTWDNFVRHALRAGVIAFLMTAAGFNQLIAGPAMNTIPAWIAQTTNAATSVTSGATQFDLIWSAYDHQKAAILEQATGIENLGYRIEAFWYGWVAYGFLLIGFWLYEFSRMIMGLLVATLPFVLGFYLFEPTRRIPIRIFEKGIGVLILQLMLSIMIQLMIQGDSYILQTAYATAPSDIEGQLDTLLDLDVFFAFGVGMIIFIPGIASYIGGGIALNVVGSAKNFALRGMTAIRGAAGVAGRAGSRAIQRARR